MLGAVYQKPQGDGAGKDRRCPLAVSIQDTAGSRGKNGWRAHETAVIVSDHGWKVFALLGMTALELHPCRALSSVVRDHYGRYRHGWQGNTSKMFGCCSMSIDGACMDDLEVLHGEIQQFGGDRDDVDRSFGIRAA